MVSFARLQNDVDLSRLVPLKRTKKERRMLKTAEAVSIGHPDKIADYISSYILDRFIEQDPNVRFALEVMIKNNTVVLGGEISGLVEKKHIQEYVKEALCEIGYDENYSRIWKDKAININQLNVIDLSSFQSEEIAKGVRQNGWGDQGVFVGYACQGKNFINRELFLAKKLNNALYLLAQKSQNLGLDIKTQITINENGHITTAIVAIPMLENENLNDFIIKTLEEKPDEIIVNGTGIYQTHSSIADCGITGRKLACDFYSTACPIGGGSPWTKDASKADLTLNLYARYLAVQNLKHNDECFVYLSSCIGQSKLPSAMVKTIHNNRIHYQQLSCDKAPSELIEMFSLNKPVYAKMCKDGLTEFIC